jgi:hypothetical protein
MTHLKSLLILFILLITTTSLAQKENAQKIQGCWVFKKMVAPASANIPQESMPPADSITVCFEANGKYTSTMTNNTAPITGQYQISADGKTITQQRDVQEENTFDEDASIEFPNENSIILKLEYAHLYFERKL